MSDSSPKAEEFSCPNCQESCSKGDVSCPHCGFEFFKLQKKWFVLGGVILLFLALIGVLFFPYDSPVVEVEEVKFNRKSLPLDQNAYIPWKKAVEAIDLSREEEKWLRDMTRGVSWDGEEMAKILKKNEEVFSILKKGSHLKKAAFPLPEELNYGMNLPNFVYWRHLSKLLEARVEFDKREGEIEKAWDLASLWLQYSFALHDSGGPLIAVLVTTASIEEALASLAELATYPLKKERLLEMARKLREKFYHQALLSGYLTALKIEYNMAFEVIDSWERGEEVILQRPVASKLPYYFAPNETRKLLARDLRLFLKAAKTPYYQRGELRKKIQKRDERLSKLGSSLRDWKGIARRNAFGLKFYANASLNFSSFFERTTRTHISLDIVSLALALGAYHRDRGRLPEKLSHLQPDYLKEIPIDRFTGKSFVYDRQGGSIQSAGWGKMKKSDLLKISLSREKSSTKMEKK